jgi:LysM repeat protein
MTWANGRDVTERRQRRAARHLRWRRLLVATAVVSLVVLLVLPLRALGTVTVSGQPTPGGTPAGLMDGSVYVVQPGDTLSSIAHRINPSGDQRAMAAQMASEVGSSVVVPGEHVVLP